MIKRDFRALYLDNDVGVNKILMTANAGENSDRESKVGRLAHYCVRRGVPNLQ